MEKTSVQYIKEAAKKLVDSKLQRLGAAKTQEIFKGGGNADCWTGIFGGSLSFRCTIRSDM